MLRNDYVLKIVEKIGRFMQKLARSKKREHIELEEELGELFHELFGIELELAFVMDTPQLVSLLQHPEEMRAMADLFCGAAVLWENTRPERFLLARRRALELYLENLYAQAESTPDEVLAAILDLREDLDLQQLDGRYRATLAQLDLPGTS